MDSKSIVRNESDADADAIGKVTADAFRTLEIGNHTEQFIIEALRAAKALTVSLVAELDGAVTGHIAFSPVAISDGTRDWYALGPVSVLPIYQRQGIGKALIEEGLSRLKAMNARGCCLVGHPDYYRQFGFRNPSGLVVEGVPPEVFFALSFDGRYPRGSVSFHEGFNAEGKEQTMIEHTLDTANAILFVRPKAALEKGDFEQLAKTVDPFIEKSGGLAGLIIEAAGFPGWDSLGAMAAHFRFVRDHHRRIKKVGVVTDSAMGNVAERLASHFVAAEIRHFAAKDLEAAKQWVAQRG